MQQFRSSPYRAPVSIAERLVPSLGFAVAAVAGGIGAILIRTLFESMKAAEAASVEAAFVGLASVAAVTGGILAASAGIGVVGILVSLGRIFLAKARSSPPGFLLLLSGSVSIVSPTLVLSNVFVIANAIAKQNGLDPANAASIISLFNILAIAVAVVSLSLLAMFPFVPIEAKTGRKYSPLVVLLLLESAIVALAAAFFWVTRSGLVRSDIL